MSKRSVIAVVGSINMDLVIGCQHLPKPGETILADASAEVCGGKGANQAVAAAKSGGDVYMIGRVGDDGFGISLQQNLADARVACDGVLPTNSTPSGLAVVAVEETGQNAIMVVPGANAMLTESDVLRQQELIQKADVLLVQLEVPIATIVVAISIAQKSNTRVILDPAPVPYVLPDRLYQVDLICPNETEASQLTEVGVQSVDDAMESAKILQRRGAKNVAITLGARGTLLLNSEGVPVHIPAFNVEPKDSTAAGDAFAGALAVRWSEGSDLTEAVRFANAAGAIAASRLGAQPGMGSRAEIEDLLQRPG